MDNPRDVRATPATNDLFAAPQGDAGSDARPTELADAASAPNLEFTQLNRTLADQMDQFSVLGVVGRGGFGTVYKAYDKQLDRDVALKVLNNPLDETGLKQFRREAKVIAALGKHPAIVQIFAFGEFDGRPYFVLDYVESNAQRLLDKSPGGLTMDTALRIAQEAAGALGYAHDRGILHRDVKPANILLEAADHRVKLADFGLSRILGRELAKASQHITGTPVYMSPEQVAGDTLDGRCDVYALGITLYQLLSGGLPFDDQSPSAVFEQIRVNNRTPLRGRRPDLPGDVLDVVEKATAHDRNQRYPSAWEFEEALGQLRKEHCGAGETSRALPRRTRRMITARWGKVVSVPLVLVAAATGIVFLLTARTEVAGAQLIGDAKKKMDAYAYADARTLYQEAALKDADNPEAYYGLGFAELLLGNLPPAEQAFGSIENTSGLRPEALAAVLAEKNLAESAPQLEAAAKEAQYSYAAALLARLDLTRQQYEAIVQRIEPLGPKNFYFNWQYEEARQILGQAYYKLGKYENARRVFSELARHEHAQVGSTARAYMAAVEAQQKTARNAEIQAQALEIRKLMDADPELKEYDPWTSRPLSVLILPVEGRNAQEAIRAGIPDLLSDLVADYLNKAGALRVVDRELIQAVLSEQQLSARLSARDEQVQLGRLTGARLLVSGYTIRLPDKERLMLKAVDAETTYDPPVEDLVLEPGFDLDSVAKQTADAIAIMADKSYPLQARLYIEEDKAKINIGADVGLQAGTTFDVREYADEPVVPDLSVKATGAIGAALSEVVVEGIEDLTRLPSSVDTGWYVRELRTETDPGEKK